MLKPYSHNPKFRLLIFIGTFLLPFFTYAQGSYIPFDRDYYHKIERYEILQGSNNAMFHTGTKPYRRDHVAQFLDSIANDAVIRTSVDRFNLAYLSQDNWEFVSRETPESEKPFLNKLYRRPGDLGHYYNEEFDIHVSPVLYLNGGMEPDNDQNPNRLSRGVVLRGSIDKKVGFYTYFSSSETFSPVGLKAMQSKMALCPAKDFGRNTIRMDTAISQL